MSLFQFIFYVLLGFFGPAYAAVILYYTLGWFRLRVFSQASGPPPATRCSVIVPARNEQDNIGLLLEDLHGQSLDKALFEVLVVDDQSTDDTAGIVSRFGESHPGLNLKLLRLTSDHKTTAFKKKAIEEAIHHSSGALIVTTDADCRAGRGWLETMAGYYEASGARMVVGPVGFHRETSFFERMQTLEFLSLIGITAGAISMHRPVMCNGANLAYEKSAFFEAGGFGASRFSSGDDVFLMFRMQKIFGNRAIRFLKSRDALVHTTAKKQLGDFIQQRTRWASKNKGYKANILMVSFTVYMVNLLLLSGLALSLAYPEWWPLTGMMAAVKFIIDLPILIGIGNFVKRPGMVLYSIPLVVVYPMYIVLVGALGVLGNYRWKGRKVKN